MRVGEIGLQKVFACTSTTCRNGSLVFWDGAEDTEFWDEIFSNIHDRRHVAAAVAVIGSGPYGDDRLLREMILGEVNIYVSE